MERQTNRFQKTSRRMFRGNENESELRLNVLAYRSAHQTANVAEKNQRQKSGKDGFARHRTGTTRISKDGISPDLPKDYLWRRARASSVFT
jgi:hypothetical protein